MTTITAQNCRKEWEEALSDVKLAYPEAGLVMHHQAASFRIIYSFLRQNGMPLELGNSGIERSILYIQSLMENK